MNPIQCLNALTWQKCANFSTPGGFILMPEPTDEHAFMNYLEMNPRETGILSLMSIICPEDNPT